jgi:hypothetical protein
MVIEDKYPASALTKQNRNRQKRSSTIYEHENPKMNTSRKYVKPEGHPSCSLFRFASVSPALLRQGERHFVMMMAETEMGEDGGGNGEVVVVVVVEQVRTHTVRPQQVPGCIQRREAVAHQRQKTAFHPAGYYLIRVLTYRSLWPCLGGFASSVQQSRWLVSFISDRRGQYKHIATYLY